MVCGTLEPANTRSREESAWTSKIWKYFAAIARCGNITRAAQQLYVSQPTLSKFLQKLEGDTGLVLFQRAGRRLELTYAGQRYLAHAERLLSQKREMDAELTDLLRADTGVLHVGMPPFRCSFSLPEVLPAFRAQFRRCSSALRKHPAPSWTTNCWKARSTWPFI